MARHVLRSALLAGALAAASAAWPAAAHAADDAAMQAQRTMLERIRTLRAQRPADGVLDYYEAMTLTGLGEREAAISALRRLLGRRLGILPAQGMGFDALWPDPEFATLRAQLAAEETETPSAPVSLRLADAGLIPEGIAWDARGKRFLVGSIAQRKIVAVDAAGTARDFSSPADGLDPVLGLAVDAPRGVLWAVSTNGFVDAARTARRNAVLRYDLASGRLLARHDAPAALQLNDVAVAPDGTLWVTDSQAGSLYRMRPGEQGLAAFGPARGVPGANGVAVGADGAVYVALSTGVARIDPADGEPRRLAQPDGVVTAGIDGLYWHDGDLIGVQNVTNPGRVIRIALADGGKRIAGVAVLQSHHHPAFAEPTTGAIADGALHVIANSHVRAFRPDGTIEAAATLSPPVVIAVPLRRAS